jgi:hypothetical protein
LALSLVVFTVIGVGHFLTASSSVVPALPSIMYPCRAEDFASVEVAVGQSPVRSSSPDDEDALALVRGPDLRRCPQCRRSSVAHRLEVSKDERCSGRQMTADVLDDDEAGLEGADEVGGVGPEVALVLDALLLASRAPGLTRDPPNDAIHDSTPRARIEGGEVAPDRCRIQPPFFHASDQVRDCEGFPFDVTDRASAEACSSESVVEAEVEPSDTGAEGEDVDGR